MDLSHVFLIRYKYMQEREEVEERDPLPEKQIFQNVCEAEVMVPQGFFF